MHIGGITKNTLLDYPGRVAATIFTGGCNLRCLFCQNSSLAEGLIPEINETDVLSFLEKRKGLITGVCISGGEPTLQPDLADFLREIKDMGYDVKLDTNGFEPQVLRNLAEEELVDYIALDIKTSKPGYRALCNTDIDLDKLDESIGLIKEGLFKNFSLFNQVKSKCEL